MIFSLAWSACFPQSERLQPMSANQKERELSGFPGQIWGSLPRPMLQTVCPRHKWADGKNAWEGHDQETAKDEGGADAQDWNLLWLDVRWSGGARERVGILESALDSSAPRVESEAHYEDTETTIKAWSQGRNACSLFCLDGINPWKFISHQNVW